MSADDRFRPALHCRIYGVRKWMGYELSTRSAGVKRYGCTIADLDRLVPLGRIGKPEELTCAQAVA